jgi:iduronate 2-sulfatase
MRLLFCLLALVCVSPLVAAEKPNVLFIVADDLRTELGCYGSVAQTPHIDALAQRGVQFNHAYCQQAVCNPSRSSFLTGKRPDSLHLWVNGTHFRKHNPDVLTLPQYFKQEGYETRCCGKVFHNWHTDPKGDRPSWSADEFLHYANHGSDAPLVKGEQPPNEALEYGRKYGDVPLAERRDVPDDAYFDGRVAREAIKTLAEVKDKPFFLAVGFWKPHAPFNAPKKYWDLYDRAKLPVLNPARPKDAPELAFHDSREILGLPPNQIKLGEEQVRELRHGYLACVSYMDAQVGKVLAALKEHGLDKNTVVVFVSDHGYHLGEHTLWAKTSCFERDAHVPLIIAPPSTKQAGKQAGSMVELVDLFPTLTELCGLKTPAGLDGMSLVPALQDVREHIKRGAFTQHPRPAYPDRTPQGVPEAMGYSVRIQSCRYTQWRDWETGKILAEEFYDYTEDPDELVNNFPGGMETDAFQIAREELEKMFPLETPPSKR